MLRLFGQLISLCLILIGCNGISHSINNSVEKDFSNAQEALRQEDKQSREAYAIAYQAAILHISNPVLQGMLFRLDSSIVAGARYMDSISGEMSLLDDKDPSNMEHVKILFLYKGIGDSIYTTLRRVNDLAMSIAQGTSHALKVDSLRLTVLNQVNTDDWKQQNFSVASPFTATILLHDFTYEIFRVGKECLPGK